MYKSGVYLATNTNYIELHKVKYYIIQNNNIYVLCYSINVNGFDQHFQSFEIGSLKDSLTLKNVEDFYTLPIHLYPMNNGKMYFRIKYA